MLAFQPKTIIKSLVSDLSGRNRDIILQRFGIGMEPERKTLEAIGDNYNITRERVRQIENFGLNIIRQSDNFASARDTFAELRDIISKRGWIVSEKNILDYLTDNPREKNRIHFLFVIGDDFIKMKEDDEFHHRWTIDEQKAGMIHDVLSRLHQSVNEEDLLPEDEIILRLKNYADEALREKISEEIIRSWLNISKLVARNALGDWGRAYSPSIRPRGMRDLAFLILRKQNSPMHFNDVADAISEIFPKNVHPATVHNELIKDDRFVLVGRGLYALDEWGYSAGIVRDVIKNILQSSGPLSKDELTDRVLKERYVKKNTILVNLQNQKYFKRDEKGNYAIA